MIDRLPTKLLYVEDNEDLRELIARVLVEAGYDVTGVFSAEDALEALQATHFDVLLTDYNLPRENGAWLLERARSLGRLEKTAVVVLTSERKPRGVDGHLVLQKPVDVAVLLSALDSTVGSALPIRSMACAPELRAELELVLYVTSTSQESQKAIRNLHRALRAYDAERVHLEIFDVALAGGEGWSQSLDDDRIIVTPTLVKRYPLPKTWIVGALAPISVVDDLLVSVLGAPNPARAAARGR